MFMDALRLKDASNNLASSDGNSHHVWLPSGSLIFFLNSHSPGTQVTLHILTNHVWLKQKKKKREEKKQKKQQTGSQSGAGSRRSLQRAKIHKFLHS